MYNAWYLHSAAVVGLLLLLANNLITQSVNRARANGACKRSAAVERQEEWSARWGRSEQNIYAHSPNAIVIHTNTTAR